MNSYNDECVDYNNSAVDMFSSMCADVSSVCVTDGLLVCVCVLLPLFYVLVV